MPLQEPGEYYLEWVTGDASEGVGVNGAAQGGYSGGCVYENGEAQSYDFRVRWYTVSFEDTGSLISNRKVLDYTTIQVTVSWGADVPEGTTLTVSVSNENTPDWEVADNGQIVYFDGEDDDLKYKIEMTSNGDDTPVLNWIRIDQSVVDYGVNPSIALSEGIILIAYQAVSENHEDERDITVARTTDIGRSWDYTTWYVSTAEENGIPKLALHGQTVELIYVSSATAETQPIGWKTSYDLGATWSTYGTIPITPTPSGITGPESLSVVMRGNNLYVSYSGLVNGGTEIHTKWGLDDGTSGLCSWGSLYQHTTADAFSPSVAVDSLKNLYIAWTQTEDSTYLKIVNRSGAGELLDDEPIAINKNGNDHSILVMDKSDSIHIAWKETVNGKEVVKYWKFVGGDNIKRGYKPEIMDDNSIRFKFSADKNGYSTAVWHYTQVGLTRPLVVDKNTMISFEIWTGNQQTDDEIGFGILGNWPGGTGYSVGTYWTTKGGTGSHKVVSCNVFRTLGITSSHPKYDSDLYIYNVYVVYRVPNAESQKTYECYLKSLVFYATAIKYDMASWSDLNKQLSSSWNSDKDGFKDGDDYDPL